MKYLPPISSKFWPRLMFVVAVIVGLSVVAKTRAEVLRSREHAHAEMERRIGDRSRADRIEAAWNPGHLVPMTEDVFGGVPDDQVRPTRPDPAIVRPPAPASESTQVEIEWTSPSRVRALLDRRFDGPRGDTAFVSGVAADFEELARFVPPTEPR